MPRVEDERLGVELRWVWKDRRVVEHGAKTHATERGERVWPVSRGVVALVLSWGWGYGVGVLLWVLLSLGSFFHLHLIGHTSHSRLISFTSLWGLGPY